jgi:hypothetical protein
MQHALQIMLKDQNVETVQQVHVKGKKGSLGQVEAGAVFAADWSGAEPSAHGGQ